MAVATVWRPCASAWGRVWRRCSSGSPRAAAPGDGFAGLPGVADDDRWMDEALTEARAARQHEDVPVGAVVVSDGRVIARGRNRREADQDPTAHAEILALREASKAVGSWRLDGCALYVTVEPCAMCAGAAILARLPLVVFGAPEPRTGAVISVAQLLDEPALNHHPKWRMGVRRGEAEALLTEFFHAHRDSPPA